MAPGPRLDPRAPDGEHNTDFNFCGLFSPRGRCAVRLAEPAGRWVRIAAQTGSWSSLLIQFAEFVRARRLEAKVGGIVYLVAKPRNQKIERGIIERLDATTRSSVRHRAQPAAALLLTH